jgi:hypothetical protein
MTTTIQTTGGLCNRLQALLSFRAALGPLRVIWDLSAPVACGRFDEAFEPLEGVSFVYLDPKKGEMAKGWDIGDAHYVHKAAPADWAKAHAELRPLAPIAAEVLMLRSQVAPTDRHDVEGPDGSRTSSVFRAHYAAIHVRRTDFVPHVDGHNNCLEPEDEFVQWAKKQTSRVYIATDNGETQDFYLQALGDKAVIGKKLPGKREQTKGDDRRQGTIEDAVTDLFVAAGATWFKGTRGSSYSETIERIRAARTA